MGKPWGGDTIFGVVSLSLFAFGLIVYSGLYFYSRMMGFPRSYQKMPEEKKALEENEKKNAILDGVTI
jgi:hypothetical protein